MRLSPPPNSRWPSTASLRTTPGTQVATVGRIRAEPGAPNVIPGRVTLSLEIRDLAEAKMESVFRAIEAEAKRIADARATPINFAEVDIALAPAPTDQRITQVIANRRPPWLSHRRCRAAPVTTPRKSRTLRRSA